MTIEKTVNGTELTLKVSGRLDTMTAPDLEAELNNSLPGAESLVLDFSSLDYISSAGLRVLLSAHKVMAGKGGMTVTHVNEIVQVAIFPQVFPTVCQFKKNVPVNLHGHFVYLRLE